MAIDNFDLHVAINEIESQQSDCALRWVMLKMWLEKQEAAQQSGERTVESGRTLPAQVVKVESVEPA